MSLILPLKFSELPGLSLRLSVLIVSVDLVETGGVIVLGLSLNRGLFHDGLNLKRLTVQVKYST